MSERGTQSSSTANPDDAWLDAQVEEYVALLRAGGAPSIREFAARAPRHSAQLERLLSTLVELEGVAQSPLPLNPKELGDFEIVRELGRGGMGVVFEAIQRSLGRRVALKMLPPQATLDPRYLERFRRESREAARLAHAHIVPVYGVGTDGTLHWFAMQFVDGIGLDRVIDAMAHFDATRAPQSLAERVAARIAAGELGVEAQTPSKATSRLRRHCNIAQLVADIARALAYAHAHGVVHRDVKPSNVLVEASGHAWLSDFGLCRAESSDDLTITGDVVGTLRYMPPERFSGKSDGRGDVYALGLVLYELLTLRPAIDEASRTVALRRIQEGVLSHPRRIDASIPVDLETICGKATAVDPDERYPSAQAFADDLQRFVEGRAISARPPSLGYLLGLAVRRNKLVAAVAAVALVALLVGATAYVLNMRSAKLAAETARDAERVHLYAAKIAAAQAAFASGDGAAARVHLDAAPEEMRGWEWSFLDGESAQPDSVLHGSGYEFHALAYTPDGLRIAALEPTAVRVFDSATGALLRDIEEVHSRGAGCAFVSASELIVAHDAELEIWDIESGQRVRSFGAHSGEIADLALDEDKQWLATASYDATGAAWEIATGERKASFEPRSGELRAVAISDDASLAAFGGTSGDVSLWRVHDGMFVRKFRAHGAAVRGLAFSVHGELLASAAADTTVRLWRVADGTLEATLLGHSATVTRVEFSDDGQRLASSSFDKTVRIWNFATRSSVRALLGHDAAVTSLAFAPDGKRIWSTGWDSTCRAWDLDDPRSVPLLAGPLLATGALAFDPEGARLAAAGGDGPLVRIYDAATREQSDAYLAGHSGASALAWSHDGDLLAIGEFRPGDITVWDTRSRQLVRRLTGAAGPVFGLAFHADGRLFSGALDRTVRAWDVDSGECLTTRTLPAEVHDIALSADGRWAAAPCWDHTISLWPAGDLTQERVLAGHGGSVKCVAFSPDSRELASAGEDRAIRLWDVASGECTAVLQPQRPATSVAATAIADLAYIPEQRRIVSIAHDQRVTVWNRDTGQAVLTFDVAGWGRALAVSPDGRALAAEDQDRAIRIWSLAPSADERATFASALSARGAGWRWADELLARHGSRSTAEAALEAEPHVLPSVQASATRRLRSAWSGPEEAQDYCWSVAFDPTSDEGTLWGADATCWVLERRAHEVSMPDPSAVWGAIHYRLGCIWDTKIANEDWGLALWYSTRAKAVLQREDGRRLPEVCAFLAMTHARRGEPEAARINVADARTAAEQLGRADDEALLVLIVEAESEVALAANR